MCVANAVEIDPPITKHLVFNDMYQCVCMVCNITKYRTIRLYKQLYIIVTKVCLTTNLLNVINIKLINEENETTYKRSI